MRNDLVFLLSPLLFAGLVACPREALATSTPPSCNRAEVVACKGAEPNAPCEFVWDSDAAPAQGKCVEEPCMAGFPSSGDREVGSVDKLTCRPINTCEHRSVDPELGGPCVGKDIGSSCSSEWLADGGICKVVSGCDELVGDPPVYVAGRFVSCEGRRRGVTYGSDYRPPEESSGCSTAPPPATGGSSVIGMVGALGTAFAIIARASRRRRSA